MVSMVVHKGPLAMCCVNRMRYPWQQEMRIPCCVDAMAATQAMADQGSGGAYEISQRMTAMVGWGATTNFQEDWTWDQAAETYALDKDMAEKLRKNNPQVTHAFLPVLSALHSRPGTVIAEGRGRLCHQFMACVRGRSFAVAGCVRFAWWAAGLQECGAEDAGSVWQGHVERQPRQAGGFAEYAE